VEYEKALAISGTDDPFVAGKLSRTYLELSQYEKAIELATPLAAADGSDSVPFVTLGLAHLARGDLDAARSGFESALRVSPFDPAVRCSLADIYAQSGDDRAERERRACELVRR
jgi:Flp pilus assembly protein TadD